MRELKSVEEKILDRALYLIGKNRSINISVRAIAKEANVNVSAINYYFRTKEEMLRQVKEFYITNTLSITSILDNEEFSDEEKLLLASNEIMEYIIRFPGVTVILRDASKQEVADEISSKILAASKEMNEKFESILYSVTKDSSMSCEHKYMIFMSSIIHPIENSDILNFDHGIIESREKRIDYIKNIIKALKIE
ncbi:TetR/AcrR family transcriptional regulator [Clostridium swellfunianum]|uniref:TetR/AcrR family transcriptional regulator n=1 Tax=Clostridium swellfunianum TaxID=1367462 RepID=UPI002030D890|nr:TetR/AcrR family transcriptional regulator [Clostridium swellfunianum]MCM0649938.1 TetR/AcrR family transcriptional regulator [Clostridium swellfunianum]